MKKGKPPKSGKKWHQGQFHPQNKEKYKGSYPIIYRSSWELDFMMACDRKSSIVQWGSESLVVIYEDASRKNSKHRYFVDFNLLVRTKDKTLQKIFIEVKPFSQTQPPKNKKAKSYKKSLLTYVQNICKWKAATKVAKSKGGVFKILTEKGLIDVNL